MDVESRATATKRDTREGQRRRRQKLRTRAFAAIGNCCVFCKSSVVQAAHVIPTKIKGGSRGMDRRYMDVIKNPDCYRPMCSSCHRAYDKIQSDCAKEVVDEIPF